MTTDLLENLQVARDSANDNKRYDVANAVDYAIAVYLKLSKRHENQSLRCTRRWQQRESTP